MDQSEKEKLFLSLLDQHKKQVYRVCWGFTNNPNDVNELFQESMIRIWKGLDGFKGLSATSTWVYRIAVNTCIFWQKKKKSVQLFSDIENEFSLPTVQPVEDLIIEGERILKLRAAIQQLSKIDRTLILLLLEDCAYKEIAEITGLSPSNVGVKINRIKKQLKTLIDQN